MEGSHKLHSRGLRRCHQCCRYEEQLWTLAYEQLYPRARRPRPARSTNEKARTDQPHRATRSA
jgi:hypothetical protein